MANHRLLSLLAFYFDIEGGGGGGGGGGGDCTVLAFWAARGGGGGVEQCAGCRVEAAAHAVRVRLRGIKQSKGQGKRKFLSAASVVLHALVAAPRRKAHKLQASTHTLGDRTSQRRRRQLAIELQHSKWPHAFTRHDHPMHRAPTAHGQPPPTRLSAPHAARAGGAGPDSPPPPPPPPPQAHRSPSPPSSLTSPLPYPLHPHPEEP